MSQHLVKRGIIEQRKVPFPHIVAKFPCFKHPRANLRVTIFLTSNVALPSYWSVARYGLVNRYDRIYCEDGQPAVPAHSARGMLSRAFRVILPIFPYRMTYADPAADGAKYVTLQAHRDPIESQIAFQSVKSNDSPLTDPRSRRLYQALEELGDTVASATANRPMTVAVPWHMYHAPYLVEKLKANGWEPQYQQQGGAPAAGSTGEPFEEQVLATRRMMLSMMFFATFLFFSIAWIFFDFVFRIVAAIFGFFFR
jgi:hypothetical protein